MGLFKKIGSFLGRPSTVERRLAGIAGERERLSIHRRLGTIKKERVELETREVTKRQTVHDADWIPMNSSNVDRIRWGRDDRLLQVIFKDGSLYQYWDVEEPIYRNFLGTHSPGQFVWYVLRQYGYRYAKLSGDLGATEPAAPRFDEHPFHVSKEIREVQKKAGRKPAEGGLWNSGLPKAVGVRKPPLGI